MADNSEVSTADLKGFEGLYERIRLCTQEAHCKSRAAPRYWQYGRVVQLSSFEGRSIGASALGSVTASTEPTESLSLALKSLATQLIASQLAACSRILLFLDW